MRKARIIKQLYLIPSENIINSTVE